MDIYNFQDRGIQDSVPLTFLRITLLMSIFGGHWLVTGINDVQGLADDATGALTTTPTPLNGTAQTGTGPTNITNVVNPVFPLSGHVETPDDNTTWRSTTESSTTHSTTRITLGGSRTSAINTTTAAVADIIFKTTFSSVGSTVTNTENTPVTSNGIGSSVHSIGNTFMPTGNTGELAHNETITTSASLQANTSPGSKVTTRTTADNTSPITSRLPYTQTHTNTTQSHETNNTTETTFANVSITVSSTSEPEVTGSGYHTSGSGDDFYADDDKFWPIAAALSVTVPAVIVFAVTITVLYRRRMNKPRSLIGMYGGDYRQM